MAGYRRYSSKRYSSAQKAAYFAKLRGRGAYSVSRSRARPKPRAAPAKRSSYAGRFLRGAGAVVGGLATRSLAGAYAGAQVAGQFSKVLGLGAYRMQKNSLMTTGRTSSQVPVMHSARDGVRIRHREFIGDISSSSTFNNTTYVVNPGIAATFPWLAAIAQNFEEYKFEGLVFEFKSTSADALNSTNTALGTVIAAAEYNSAATAYINKQQMENSMWAVSTKPSCDMMIPIECAPNQNPMSSQYVRVGDVPSGQDIRMYDLCNVQIATVGSQATAVVGELWASYDIVLYKPQMSSGLNLAGQTAKYQITGAAITTAYFGSSRTEVFDSIGMSFSGTTATFPVGSQGLYLFSYSVTGSSATVAGVNIAASNGSLESAWVGNSAVVSQNSGSSTFYSVEFIVNIPNPTLQCVITFSAGTLPTSATSSDLLITQINGNTV
jgi:hypothetical protein